MSAPFSFLNSDSRILDKIRRGDEEALVELYAANRAMIMALVTRNGGTVDDSEDMLQESIVILWERVRSGKFEYRSKLSTFLYATVKNLWSRRRARQRREVTADPDPEVSVDGDPSVLDKLIESEQAGMIARALDSIGSPCKQLLLLFYWEELPMEEIAQRLGFANAATAKSRKYQCKKELEKLLRRF